MKEVMTEIMKVHGKSEIARLELNKLNERLDYTRELAGEIKRIRSIFDTDRAFRNGMAYALIVQGVLTQDDIEYLKENTSIPERFLDSNFRNMT